MADIKSTSNAVWWIKKPNKFEHRTTLGQDMADLFGNISMHGYNKLLETELFVCEKLIWFCLHVANLVVVITVLSYTWEQFVSQYFSLLLHDPLYPIEKIPFPGISVCSNNRISRQAAEKYAAELSLRDPRNRSADYFLSRLPYLNSLYYKFQREDDHKGFGQFQSFLDTYGTAENESYYDVRKIVKMLTPNCRDFIVKCFLNDKEIECFSESAFQEGFTMYGPCCIFNTNDSYRHRNVSLRLAGAEMGLTVVINSSNSDDTVSLINMDAYIVIVHNSNNFPDIISGSATEVFPMINEESFIAVRAKSTDTSQKLRSFHPSYRQCYFSDESPDSHALYRKTYSFSNCIMSCRVRSIFALCGCVPFFTPPGLVEKAEVPYCTLHHISCLQRYNFKWRNVLTRRSKSLGLEREMEEALYCPQCLPSCDDTQYAISLMSLPADRLVIPGSEGDDLTSKMDEMTVLRVFFRELTAIQYKRVISNTWEEAFSTVGNIVSIFLGFSMMAMLEILFFLVKYLCVAVKMFVMNSEQNSKLLKNRKKIKADSNKLYILP